MTEQEIVTTHQGLVQSAARYWRRKVPNMLLEDLVAYGNIGLLLAWRRFDPSKGYQFSTFASHYIRGQILSGVTLLSGVPRRKGHERVKFAPVETADYQEDATPSPLARLIEAEDKHLVPTLLAELDRKSRELVMLRYAHDLTVEQIGDRLGMSRSWAHRKLERATSKLRAAARRHGVLTAE
jgi:RNA polymerase sigma factor (sigma-70 family)